MNMGNVKRGLKSGGTKKSHGMKSVLAILIAFTMVFTMVMPAWAFAEDGEPGGKTDAAESGEVLMDETAEDADSPDDSDTFDGEETAEGAPEADASEDDPDGGETLSEDSSDEEDPANSNAETEPEEGQEDSGFSLNEEYPLTLTEDISVTIRTHVFRSDYRQYVAIKVKNNSSETVEDVTLIDSTKCTYDDGDEDEKWTPYELNNNGDDRNWDSNCLPENATENEFGYDIEAGQTATFYLRVQSGDLRAGTYDHYIQLGKKEDHGTSPWNPDIVVTDVYSDKLPVTLNTYDPPVKITMGDLNSDYTVTAKDSVDFGTINLKTEAEENYGAITKSKSFAVRNSSTTVDEVTGEVPDLYISMADAYIYDKKYGRLPFAFNTLYYETWTDIGPRAFSDHILNLDVSDMIAGTYYGTIRANVAPGVVTVNGTKNTTGWGKRWGFFDIPVKATLTGINPNLPGAAKNLKATAGNDMVELSWEEPADFDDYYNIYRRDGTETEDDWTKYNYEPYELIGSVNGYSGKTTYVDATAKNGRTYSYMVITGSDGAEPYHGYPSNAVTCTPDESQDRKILAPVLSVTDNAGYVYLDWDYDDEPTMEGSSGEGLIDHFNVYRNGKLVSQVSQSAWHAEKDEYSSEPTYEYSWGISIVTPPGVLYSWQVAAVSETGVEGYMSEPMTGGSVREDPVLDGHTAAFYDNYDFPENGYDFYYDTKYHAGTGKGVFIYINTDEYYSGVSFINIWRKTAGDAAYTLIAERVPKNYTYSSLPVDFCDRSAAYSTTYQYKVVGTYGDGEETNAYEFTVKTPVKGKEIEYSQAYVDFDLLKGTTPRMRFSVQNDYGATSQFKLMRKGPENTDWVVEKTYSVSGDVISHKTYTDTPTIDGIYSYRLDKVTNGVLIKGHEYSYIKDTSETDEALLPKGPSAPRLTASIVNEDVMLRWSSTGSEQIDGYYIYRTENDEPNEDNWTESDGKRSEDYPYYPAKRYMRCEPSRTSYRDGVYWYGKYDQETGTYVPQTHKWWIVAYNEYGASEPSEVITYEDQDDGEGNYTAPENSETVKPGKPQIVKMWVDYDQNSYNPERPEDVNIRSKVNVKWAESMDGGAPEYFTVLLQKQGDSQSSWKVYAGAAYEEYRSLYFPEDAGTYVATISCTNAAGTSETATQTLQVYGPPKVLTTVTARDSVLLEWTAPVETGVTVTGYEVWRCDEYGIWSSIKTTGSSVRTFEDTGLKSDIEYRYKVVAKCQDGVDRTSSILTEKPTGKKIRCSAPTSLNKKVLDGQLFLTWTPPSTGTPERYYYAVELEESDPSYNYYKTDPNGEPWPDGKSWRTDEMKYDLGIGCWIYSAIKLDKDVRVKICARNSSDEDYCNGWGLWTDPITVKLTSSQASSAQQYQPAAVYPTVKGSENKITITWKSTPKNSYYDGAAYYVITRYKYVAGADYEDIAWIMGNPAASSAVTYSYEDTDIEAGIDYRYRVTAYNAAGGSYPNYWFTARAAGTTENEKKIALIRDLVNRLPDDVDDITTDNYQNYEDDIEALRGLYEGLTSVAKSMLEDEEKEQIEALIGKYDKARAQAEYAELITQADAFMAMLPDPADLTAENIGDYRTAVDNANAVLAKLPAEARAGVDTSRLDAIKAKLEEMKKIEADMKAAKAVSDKIDALPNAEDVTLLHKNLILNARAAYNRLTEDQKQYVNAETLAHLTACEEAIAPLLIKDAEDKIRNLPDPAVVTLADEDQINSAKDAFDILSDEDKAKVSDELRQKLEDVLAALHELKRVPLAVSMATSKPAAVYYNGKAQKPGFVLKYNGDTLVSGVDYTAVYSSNKNVGKGKVVVTGTGDFKGTITFTFKINPKGLKLKKVYAGRRKAKVTWKALKTKMSKSRVTGYEIQYSRKSTMKSSKTKKVKGYKKSSVTIKKLKGKKVYYFRIRTYLKTGGKTYRSKWSAKKKIRVKK